MSGPNNAPPRCIPAITEITRPRCSMRTDAVMKERRANSHTPTPPPKPNAAHPSNTASPARPATKVAAAATHRPATITPLSPMRATSMPAGTSPSMVPAPLSPTTAAANAAPPPISKA